MNEKKITMDLPCELTEEEARDRTSRLVHLLKQQDSMRRTHAETRREMKEEKDTTEGAILRTSEVIREGKEDRPVQCLIRPNPEALTVETIRLDTGEVIASRDMSKAERNLELDLDPK